MKLNIPPKFSDLEVLSDEDLRKLHRMAKAVLNERSPGAPSSKSNNIELAFKAVPRRPTNAESFCKKYKISINTLRQQKRFDPQHDEDGVNNVVVRKNKSDGKLYVWRGDPDLLKK